MLIFSFILTIFATDNCPENFDFTNYDGNKIEQLQYHECLNSKAHNLVIPESITSIGIMAFYRCIKITGKLTINGNIDTISISAFQSCTGITEIEFNGNTQKIEENAFARCSQLKTITFPDSLSEIGKGAFYQCTQISAINLPTVVDIYDHAFSECSGLKNINFENCILHGVGVFERCTGLTGTLTIPSSWNDIPSSTFAYCTGLNSLVLNENIADIYDRAFYKCTGLTGSLEFINERTKISIEAFKGCSGLESLRNFDRITSIDRSAFEKCTKIDGALNFNEDIITIPDFLFSECSNLKGPLKIPFSVINIGSHSFYDCKMITFDSNSDLHYVYSIGDYSFYCCSNFNAQLTFSSDITNIGEYAFFNCTQLQSELLFFENPELNIGAFAFYGCTKLGCDLIFLTNAYLIGEEAFNLTNISQIIYYGYNSPSCSTIGKYIDVYVPFAFESKSFCDCVIIADIPSIGDIINKNSVSTYIKSPTDFNSKDIYIKHLQDILSSEKNENSTLIIQYLSSYNEEIDEVVNIIPFNNQMEPNQFLFPETVNELYIWYFGGKLNILNENDKTYIVTENKYEFDISFLGNADNIIFENNEETSASLEIHTNSTIIGNLEFIFGSNYISVDSISIDDLTLMNGAHIRPCKYLDEREEESIPKLEIKKLTVEPYSNVYIENAKITGPFTIKQSAKIQLANVDLSGSDIIYQMGAYYNKNNIFIDVIESNPKSFTINENEDPKRNFKKEYILIDSYFDCQNWNIAINNSAKYLEKFECVELSGTKNNLKHYQLKLISKNGTPTFYDPDAKKEKEKKCSKLSGGAIAGIVIACLVAVAGLMVGEYFLINYLKKRKENSVNEGNEVL